MFVLAADGPVLVVVGLVVRGCIVVVGFSAVVVGFDFVVVVGFSLGSSVCSFGFAGFGDLGVPLPRFHSGIRP